MRKAIAHASAVVLVLIAVSTGATVAQPAASAPVASANRVTTNLHAHAYVGKHTIKVSFPHRHPTRVVLQRLKGSHYVTIAHRTKPTKTTTSFTYVAHKGTTRMRGAVHTTTGHWVYSKAVTTVWKSRPKSTCSTSTTMLRPDSTTSLIARPSGSGAYTKSGSPDAMRAFATWRKCKADFAMEYLPMSSWSALDSPTWALTQWHSASVPLVIGVPMLPDVSSTNIAAGAKGDYDTYFKTLARTLVAHGYGAASLRVGWEMNNGTAFRWTAAKSNTDWVTYYRKIVTTMRSVPGQKFRFDWNINLGSATAKPTDIYPGDKYVDYIGVDVYDWKWNDASSSPATRWAWIKSQPYGLNWVASFAKKHGKRVTIPEWGLAAKADNSGGGGGDDPYYVTSMLAWIKSHDVAYSSYFNTDDHIISTGRYPDAASAYKAGLRR